MLLLAWSVRQEDGRTRCDRSHGLPLAGQAGQRRMKRDVAYLDDVVAKVLRRRTQDLSIIDQVCWTQDFSN